jgi:hypothetical protein
VFARRRKPPKGADGSLLDEIRTPLRERLDELRGLVAEYERFGDAERARGQTRRMLAVVGQRPGVTKAELKAATACPVPAWRRTCGA